MEAESGMGRAVEVRKSQANGKCSSANGDVVGVESREELPSSSPSPAAAAVAGRQQVSMASSPRPAPAYRVVSAVIEKKEDGPGPRCGHTLTAVAAVGEEGTPGYLGPRLILFGGATALEGNSSGPGGPQTASAAAGISKISSSVLALCVVDDRFRRSQTADFGCIDKVW
uniref:Uncharacterized protein n=1 Tax=Physcomitrium patens TaxID=3218 RepID=A0A2K1L297_PHYPA|nr:hypothetical protein PHYPA_002934 [Physcomitrium patens]